MILQIVSRRSKTIVQSTLLFHKRICVRTVLLSRRSSSEVRVRFAPSPTGFLHLGGLRTALYNYLFARSMKGKFILRIEDTDQTRLVPEAAENLEAILRWAGILPDESPVAGGVFGPYVQSLRSDIYQSHIQKLLNNGTAYRCFCTETRLNLLRRDLQRRGETVKYDNRCRHLSGPKIEKFESEGLPFCVRLKLEDITEPFQDLVYGSILNNIADQEGDPVLVKTDGYPTYHFANVVDDHLMGVTHVLRGVEWQVSTPKHLLLYDAFGWDPPQFAHLPLIKNSDGTKLSKRQGDLHVESLRSQGYSPKTIINFVTNIGGGFENREHNIIHSMEEMVEKFRLERINPNSCKLEMERLSQFSQLDLTKRLEVPSDAALVVEELRQVLLHTFGNERLCASGAKAGILSDENLLEVLTWSKDRIFRLSDLVTKEFEYIWVVPEDLALHQLPSVSGNHADLLSTVMEDLSSIPQEEFTKENTSKSVKDIGKKKGLKNSVVMALVRRAISGLKQGPPVGEMLAILGKDSAIERLRHARSLLL